MRLVALSAAAAAAVAIGGGLSGCSGSGDAASAAGNDAVYQAWRAHRSHVEVTASGVIARVLGTREGPSGVHEGFLLHLSGAAGRGLTVRVEDNVDLTGPIPLSPSEQVVVRGEYEFDPRGGVIHWTHRDPRGRHAPGYVLVGGRRYQ